MYNDGPWYFFASLRAPNHCLKAQHIMSSGASIAHIISSNFLSATRRAPSDLPGMLGCKETQIHAKMVTTQLQRISQVDLSLSAVDM